MRIDTNGAVHLKDDSLGYAAIPFELIQQQVILVTTKPSKYITMPGLTNVLLFSGIAFFVSFLLLIWILAQFTTRPAKALLEGMREIGRENFDHQVPEHWGTTEFNSLSRSFNQMTNEIKGLRGKVRAQGLLEQENELRMLRAQIRPHFFLNAISTVNNMTYQNENGRIRSYLHALAKYMRYMLNLRDKKVPLADEISHIRNYLEMQQIKFPESISSAIHCPAALHSTEIPYLLLFTIVENTFKHAMDLYSKLHITIACEAFSRDGMEGTHITVEDTGKGFSPETLMIFNQDKALPDAKEHLGLTNVKRTLQLVYSRNDLLRISNTENHGACVELWIPNAASQATA